MITAENVLANPLAFKAKLAIGEDAYKSLKYGKGLQGMWDSLGIGATAAGVAKSGPIAAMIGTKTGLFAFIGFGNPMTPLPYIAAAAAGATVAYIGVMRMVRNYSNQRVDVIPKFINTPLDLLAVSLYDLLAPLAIKVACSDGVKSSSEHELIIEYFANDWGYSRDYVDQSLEVIEGQINDVGIEQLLTPFTDFIRENPDCNQAEIAKGIVEFFREIVEVDGMITEDEAHILEVSENHFNDANSFVKNLITPLNALTQKMRFRAGSDKATE